MTMMNNHNNNIDQSAVINSNSLRSSVQEQQQSSSNNSPPLVSTSPIGAGFTASTLLERIAQQLNSKYLTTPSASSNSIRELLATTSSLSSAATSNAAGSLLVRSMVSDGSDSSSASPRELELNSETTGLAWPAAATHLLNQLSAIAGHGNTIFDTVKMQPTIVAMETDAERNNKVKIEDDGERSSDLTSKSPPSSADSSAIIMPNMALSVNNNASSVLGGASASDPSCHVTLDDIDAFARPGPNYQVVDTSKLPPVYSFFTRTFVANTGEIKAYCGSCRKHIASHKGDVTRTSNLIRHLKNMHPELHQEFQSTRSRYCSQRKKEVVDDSHSDANGNDGSHHPPPERSRARKTMRLDSTNSTSSNSCNASSAHDIISNHAPANNNSRKSSTQLYRQHSESHRAASSAASAVALDAMNMISMAPPAHNAFHNNNNNNSTLLAGGGVGSSTSSSSLPHSSQNSPQNNGSAALLLAGGFGAATAAGTNGSASNGSDVDVMLLDEDGEAADDEKTTRMVDDAGRRVAMFNKQQQNNTNAAAVHSALASMLALGSGGGGGQMPHHNSMLAATSPNRTATLSASAAAAGFGSDYSINGSVNGGPNNNNNNNSFAQRSAHLMHALGLATRNGSQQPTTMPPSISFNPQQQNVVPNLPNGIHNNSNNNNSNNSNNNNNNAQQLGGLGPAALLNLARNVFSSTTFSAGSLIGVPALINPQLLYIMAKMGAGDELLFVPQNFAASTYAARNKIDLVFLNGLSLFIILEAVLRIFPIDVENGAPVMLPQAAQSANVVTTLAPVLQAAIIRNYTEYPRRPVFTFAVSREHILNAAKDTACAVIQTGERSDIMFMLLRKGSIIAADKT